MLYLTCLLLHISADLGFRRSCTPSALEDGHALMEFPHELRSGVAPDCPTAPNHGPGNCGKISADRAACAPHHRGTRGRGLYTQAASGAGESLYSQLRLA